MSKNSPTLVITDSDRLSTLADAILARAGNPRLTKNTVLNLIAGSLAGSKTNWGGLKAMSVPLRATPLDPELIYSSCRLLIEEDEDKAPYAIKSALLDFDFHHSVTSQPISVCVSVADVPAIMVALFDPKGAGEYDTNNILFEGWGAEVLATARFFDGTTGELGFDRQAFGNFLQENEAQILELILTKTLIGEALYDAFQMSTNWEELLYSTAEEFYGLDEVIHAESVDANRARVDAACRQAVWRFLAKASGNAMIHDALQKGRNKDVVEYVFDKGWLLVGEALRDMLEAEAAA